LVSASITTNRGGIGLQLDNAKTPCTVNNFASLAQQGFFDDTRCHRLTTSSSLGVLQCGDPTGTGAGGPGYRFPNEYPTNQFRLSDPALETPMLYPRGTLAMANAGPGTNGSQFFLVYRDSMLPPTYTAFGAIDKTGLATLDKIAAAGVAGGSDDGKPSQNVTIESVRLD
jgi:peptidyl-prolyl cis-trans isomerase B (cyclophilin B)